MKRACPKCFSVDTELIDYMGTMCVVCKNCGYDESTLYEIYPQGKSSQGAKGKFSPYRAGGGARSKK